MRLYGLIEIVDCEANEDPWYLYTHPTVRMLAEHYENLIAHLEDRYSDVELIDADLRYMPVRAKREKFTGAYWDHFVILLLETDQAYDLDHLLRDAKDDFKS